MVKSGALSKLASYVTFPRARRPQNHNDEEEGVPLMDLAHAGEESERTTVQSVPLPKRPKYRIRRVLSKKEWDNLIFGIHCCEAIPHCNSIDNLS